MGEGLPTEPSAPRSGDLRRTMGRPSANDGETFGKRRGDPGERWGYSRQKQNGL